MGVLVKGVSLGAAFALEGKGNHPCGTGVYVAFGQGAVPDGGGDPVLHIGAAARHTQVAPGVYGLDAVAQRAPVGHDQTGKTPIRTQHIGQQPMVVAGVDIVDARVAAHNGFGLGSLDYGFKRGQVQLTQGALIHLAVAVGAFTAVHDLTHDQIGKGVHDFGCQQHICRRGGCNTDFFSVEIHNS